MPQEITDQHGNVYVLNDSGLVIPMHRLNADGSVPTVASEIATAGSAARAAVETVAMPRGDASNDVLDVLALLAPAVHTPVITYASGHATALESPVEYRPSICGTGVPVTDWDGQDDPNLLFSGGVFKTSNGGNGDLALYGDNLPGGIPHAATWPIIVTFDTSAGVSVVEVSAYGTPEPSMRIEVNGQPVISNTTLLGTSGLGNGKKMTLTFPTAAARRIRLYMRGSMGLHAVRVPTGQSITKPSLTIRRGAIIGDSWVAGAGNAYDTPTPGASVFETFPLGVLKALGCNDFVLAGIGGTGFVAGSAASPQEHYSARVATVLAMEPDVLLISGSINDGSTPTGVQAAAEALLTATSAIAERYVIGTMLSGFGDNHDAVKAAADAQDVPFIPMKDFINGTGNAVNAPNGTGNKDIYLMATDNLHPTWRGHRAIERAVWRQIAALR